MATNLVANDTNASLPDVFLYDALSGTIERISREQDGVVDHILPEISGNRHVIAFTGTPTPSTPVKMIASKPIRSGMRE